MKMPKRPGRAAWARAIAAPLIFASSFALFPAASGGEPFAVTSIVTDRTDSVNTGKVETALNRMQDKTGKSLRVVLVEDFGSTSSSQWATKAFTRSGLGPKDAILAIATNTRQYSFKSGRDGLSRNDLRKALNGSVRSRWRAGKWESGIVKLADNVVDANTTDWGGIALGVGGVALAGGAVAGGVVVARRRKAKKAELDAAQNLQALATRASTQLLQTDDRVRSAAAELEFARAEFGVEATREFDAALGRARDAVQRAFVIRQRLYDDIPETPAQAKRMNEDILKLVETAHSSISAQEEGFRKLRDLSSRVDSQLDDLESRAAEIDSQSAVLVAQIDQLALQHGEAAVSTLRTYPEQIATFTDSARSSIASGREQIAQGNRNQAVPYMRLAEEALSHASKRVDEIGNAGQTLQQGAARLRQALTSISSDVEDAKRLGGDDQEIAACRAEAERLIAEYSGRNADPIKAVSELTTAEDALDAALAAVRSEEERRKKEEEAADRNRSMASTVASNVDGYVDQYSRYITTRTRSLLASARTDLSAGDQAASAEERARHYSTALARAREAEAMAHEDVEKATHSYRRDHFWDDGGRRRGGGDGMGGLIAGMILGSLFSGDRSDGGYHHSSDSDDGGFFGFGGGDGGLFDFGGDGGLFDFGGDGGGDSDGGSF